MSDTTQIVAGYWTVAGSCYPMGPREVSPFSFEQRVEASAQAGYRGMGFVHQDLLAVRDRLGYTGMKKILDANGIQVVEVEILTDWFAEGERRATSDRIRGDLMEAGKALGAHALKVCGDQAGAAWPHQVLADSFGELCAQAHRAGMKVGVEVMPWTNLSTVANTLAVVESAGAANGGLFLDIWHIERGTSSLADIEKLNASDIVSIEINDAAAELVGDLWNDTIHHRLLPGEGVFDVQGFIDAVKKTGYRGPCGIEVLSEKFREKPLEEAAKTSIASVRRFVK